MHVWLLYVLLGGIIGIAILVASPRVILALGFAIWAVNGTFFVPVWGLVAISGIGITLAASLKAGASGRQSALISYVPLTVAVWGLLVSPLSFAPRVSVLESLTLALLGVTVIFVSRRFTGREVCVAAYSVLMILAIASYAVAPVGVTDESGRWHGLLSNANSLGLICFTLVAVAFGVSAKAVVVAICVSGPLLVLSESRGSALAFLAAVIAGFWVSAGSTHRRRRDLVLRGMLAAAVLVVGWVLTGALERSASMEVDTGLLRATDSSRGDLMKNGWMAFVEGPKLGYGYGLGLVPGLGAGAHTQVITMAVMLGVAGIMAYVVTFVLLLRLPLKHSPPLAALVVSGLVSWLTESWMFGVGSLQTGVFWIAVSALAADFRGPDGAFVDSHDVRVLTPPASGNDLSR